MMFHVSKFPIENACCVCKCVIVVREDHMVKNRLLPVLQWQILLLLQQSMNRHLWALSYYDHKNPVETQEKGKKSTQLQYSDWPPETHPSRVSRRSRASVRLHVPQIIWSAYSNSTGKSEGFGHTPTAVETHVKPANMAVMFKCLHLLNHWGQPITARPITLISQQHASVFPKKKQKNFVMQMKTCNEQTSIHSIVLTLTVFERTNI